ncbi:cytochrome C oxidase subunit IV family protein [Gemmata sp.]|uniref:cytochrome C oxidase subunit IV family protein n=1 Tax=Gemmata sp. TaxID=1914242 RepID=UPI003F704374
MANHTHATTTATTTPPAGHTDHGVTGHVDSPATLILVFLGVLGLFALTVWMSSTGRLGGYTLFAQLAIGTVQATLVGLYFMHLRHGDKVVVLTALASVFWMGILFVLFMSDYMTRNRVMG